MRVMIDKIGQSKLDLRVHWSALVFAVAIIFCGTGMAFSEVGAPKVLQELAALYSEKGFKLRKEHWNGKLKAGQHKVVKHQLFRGNEYWFLAAVVERQYSLTVEIFDESGQAVSLERFADKGLSGARVLPVKTGTYLIKLSLGKGKESAGDGGDLDWALVYGYR